jgi:diacylglycerol kinase family enzyme
VRHIEVRRRAEAWIALAATGVAFAALVLLVFRNVLALVAALAALAIAGGAGWVAATRRGTARTVAAAWMVLALAGGAVALVALGDVDELVLLAAALAVVNAAAPRALRRRRPELVAPRPVRQHASSRAVLLMNPRSGGGKAVAYHLAGEARRRGIETVTLEPGDDLRVLADEVARSADVIGMAGGDGSQALVAQIAAEHGVDYVCVPAGTRNHFALDLGLDRDDVLGALDAFTSGVERHVDLAEVNGRVFVNNVSLGVYAEIVQSAEYRGAKLETVKQMLPSLLGPNATPFDLRFAWPGGGVQRSAQLLLVSNNPYVLDSLVGVGVRPRLDTGKLGIVAVEIAGAAEAGTLISLDALGQVRRFEGWLEWTAEQFEVASGAPVAAGIDGEATVLEPPLRFASAPAALCVRLPAAAEFSPTLVGPARRRAALRALWDVATTRR